MNQRSWYSPPRPMTNAVSERLFSAAIDLQRGVVEPGVAFERADRGRVATERPRGERVDVKEGQLQSGNSMYLAPGTGLKV